MENWTIEIDKNGKKRIWINSAFYEYDERPIEEIQKELLDFIKNNNEEFWKIVYNITNVMLWNTNETIKSKKLRKK